MGNRVCSANKQRSQSISVYTYDNCKERGKLHAKHLKSNSVCITDDLKKEVSFTWKTENRLI